VFILELIAEQKIAEAISRGELSNLPGEGRPLDLDDDVLVPEDLRMAYRVLKNSGFVPPSVSLLREVRELEALLEGAADGPARAEAFRKLEVLRLRLEAAGRSSAFLRRGGSYFPALVARFGRGL
jgi:hypothetical protein